MFGFFCPIYLINFYAVKRIRWIPFVCSMCVPSIADIERKRLFQLLNTFLIKLRSILVHSSWASFQIPFSVRALLFKSLCFKKSEPKKSSGLPSGVLTSIYSLLIMKRPTPLSSWQDNLWSSWQYDLVLYRDAEALCPFRS